MTETTAESTSAQDKEEQESVISEMNAFMRDTRLTQELKTYLKFVFEQEYKMLKSYYPNSKLLVDNELRQEQLSKVQNLASKEIIVDLKKVADSGYLDNLLNEEKEEKVTYPHISQAQYIANQLEETDTYRFMKYCLPDRYNKFVV